MIPAFDNNGHYEEIPLYFILDDLGYEYVFLQNEIKDITRRMKLERIMK